MKVTYGLIVLASFLAISCKKQPNASQSASLSGKVLTDRGITTLCTVDAKPLESNGPAQQAPITLTNKTNSWVGGGIEVLADGDMNKLGHWSVPVQVLSGTNKDLRGFMFREYLTCPLGTEQEIAKAKEKTESSNSISSSQSTTIEKDVPWEKYYMCLVISANLSENALFKFKDGTTTGVGNGYSVAYPFAEANNEFVQVYVVKGGVVTPGTLGSMFKKDLSNCELYNPI